MPSAIPLLIGAVANTAISLVATTATGLLSSALKGKSRSSSTYYRNSRDLRQQQNITSTIENIPVIYGQTRVGGIRIFTESQLAYQGQATIPSNGSNLIVNTRGDYLYITTVFGHGLIENIESILIDGIDSLDEQYQSPYKVDITLSWTFDEPPVVQEVDSSHNNNYYYNIEIFSHYNFAYNQIQEEPVKYRIYRRNIYTDKEILIRELPKSITIDQKITLDNIDYGNYEFRIEYITDIGETLDISHAIVNITIDNDDFEQTLDDNLTITQYSRQEGEYIKSEFRLGESIQSAVQFFVDELDNYTDQYRGNNLVYACHRFLKHTAGPNASNTAIKRIPEVTAIIKGRRIFDPRDTTQVFANTNSYKYSNNPSLCILDYLTNIDYGFGINYENIDTASFIKTADYCDEQILREDNIYTARYTCNGVLDTGQKLITNLRELLTCCNARIGWIMGKWQLTIDQLDTPVYTFSPHNLIGNIELEIANIRSRQNTIITRYINPEINYQFDILNIMSPEYLAEDHNNKLELEYELPYTNNYYEAQELSILLLKSSRNNLQIQFTATLQSLHIVAGDIVNLEYPAFGWVNKLFRINNVILTSDGEIQYTAIEYDSNIYITSNYQLKPKYKETSLISPLIVQAPSNIKCTQSFEVNYNNTYINTLILYWTKSPSPDIKEYQVEYRKDYYGEWIVAGRVHEAGIKINNLALGNYNIRVKAINNLGYDSPYSYKDLEIKANNNIPPNVTGLSAQANQGQILFNWNDIPSIQSNGYFRIKHIPSTDINNIQWSDLSSFEQVVSGMTSHITLPELEGIYLIKAVNLAGLESSIPAIYTHRQSSLKAYQCVQEFVAHPQFDGILVNTYKLNNKIYLGRADLWDSINNTWDNINPAWDSTAISHQSNIGVIQYNQLIDMGAIYNIYLTKSLTGRVFIDDTAWDDLMGLWNEQYYFIDGSDPSVGRINLLYSITLDDPETLTAEWSEWRDLTVNNERFRGIQFRTELITQQSEVQIELCELSAQICVHRHTEQDSIAIMNSMQNIVFQEQFYNIPDLHISIISENSGDYYIITDLNNTGFQISVYDNNNNPVNRQISYIASGV